MAERAKKKERKARKAREFVFMRYNGHGHWFCAGWPGIGERWWNERHRTDIAECIRVREVLPRRRRGSKK